MGLSIVFTKFDSKRLIGRPKLQMLTLSAERFQKIQKEAPVDCQSYLVQVTKYQAARNCKVWSCLSLVISHYYSLESAAIFHTYFTLIE